MIVAGENPAPKKKEYNWEETKEHFGDTIEEMKCEFQSIGLKSLRSSKMYENKVIVGEKYVYECSTDSCSYAARITLKRKPGSKPFIETSGNIIDIIFVLMD